MRCFACTDFGVEVSIDDGNSWTVVANGLPAHPHCREIALGLSGAGFPALYAATYGWGVFVAELPRCRSGGRGPHEHIPLVVAQLLFGIVADGGGVELVNGTVHVVPPREPARELAVGLLLAALSQRLEGKARTITAGVARDIVAGSSGAHQLRHLQGAEEQQ